MSTPSEVLPLATAEGIREFVPLQQYTSLCAERDALRHEVTHLRQSVAELNERMITEVKSYMNSMTRLRDENNQLRKAAAATIP